MEAEKPPGEEFQEDIDLPPRHEPWARLTTRNSFVGFGIFLTFAALFIVVINLHLTRSALAAVGAFAGVFVVVFLLAAVWRGTPQRRRGLLGNAGLTARIKADILTDLGSSHVNVDSVNGVVTLRGSVPYADFAEAATHLARQQGAHQVINELKVVPSAAGQPAPYLPDFPGVTTPEGAPEAANWMSLEERVQAALEDDPRVNAYVMFTRVANGVAYLTGRQDTVQASDDATEIAAHVPGVLGVSNNIEIMPSV